MIPQVLCRWSNKQDSDGDFGLCPNKKHKKNVSKKKVGKKKTIPSQPTFANNMNASLGQAIRGGRFMRAFSCVLHNLHKYIPNKIVVYYYISIA
jgi:hypothetical protein